MISIIHAYSAKNSGDGLLVELSVKMVREALGHDTPIKVIAIDPESFPSLPNVTYVGIGKSSSQADLALGSMETIFGLLNCRGRSVVMETLRHSDMVIAVGGGYMRSPGGIYSVKSLLAHSVQALAAKRCGAHRVYLPQSVGPLKGTLGKLMAHGLKDRSLIWARDDRSVQELRLRGIEAKRAPDLAVLEIGEVIRNQSYEERSADKTLIVARSLGLSGRKNREYVGKLRHIIESLPGAELVLQSTSRGNDDLSFYRRNGFGQSYMTLKEAIAAHEHPVVVSVRLHGSLQSIIRGCPSIHLSYERKGFGAYDDLGIARFVHNAFSFDAKEVVRQAQDLSASSSDFWRAVHASARHIGEKRQEVLASIRESYAPRSHS